MDESQLNVAVAAFKEQLTRRFKERKVLNRTQVEEEFRIFMATFLAGRQSQTAPSVPTEPSQVGSPATQTGDEEQILWEGRPQWTWDWFTTKYVLTTHRLIIRLGFFSFVDEEVKLERIRDITLLLPFEKRLVGIGDLRLIGTDSTSPVTTLQNISDPEYVRELIRKTKDEARRRVGYAMREQD